MPSDFPTIIIDKVDFSQPPILEQDCACAEGVYLAPLMNNVQMDVFYRFTEPISSRVIDEWRFLLVDHNQFAPVIVNDAGLQLLRRFRQPKLIEYALKSSDSAHRGAVGLFLEQCVQRGILRPAKEPTRMQPGRTTTLTVWLHVTNACNLRCPYCYLHKTPDQMELAHGKMAVDAALRSAVTHNFTRLKLKYAGGEATLNMQTVLALHAYARERCDEMGLELDGVVLSNGVSLPASMIAAIKGSGLRMMISLDGVGTVHDAQRPTVRGGSSFHYVERTLDALAKAEVIPTISITLTSRNLHGLADTVRYVLDRELPFTLNFYRDNECAGSFADLQYEEQAIIDAMLEAFAVIEENLPRYSLLGAILDRARLDVAHDRPCGVGESYMVIDQNGQVAKCQMEIEQTLTDIHAQDPLGVIRADSIMLQNPTVDEKEGCKTCQWRYWCAGGCPALTYRATGRFDVKSPNCNIYQALFPAVLRLEGLRILKYANL